MKKFVRIAIASIGVLVLVLALAFPALTGVKAQEIDNDPSTVQDSGNGPVGQTAVAAYKAIPVQGRLTDSHGVPVNGSREITMSLYDVSTGGVARCTDADTVTVTNGLWFTYMDYCDQTDINGDQLYLGIQVTGEALEMTPRELILPVPYAYNLVSGAKLDVGTVRSSAYTYVYASPQKAVAPSGSNINIVHYSDGYVEIKANSAGTQWVYIPVDLIGTQYGTKYTFTNLRVCYKLDSAASFITETNFRILNDDLTSQNAVLDTNDRTSTTAACYIVTNATNELVDGSAMVRLVLTFANTTDHIYIGNIRVALAQP
jgi:hypothetical protein